jgi:hypothetical protein
MANDIRPGKISARGKGFRTVKIPQALFHIIYDPFPFGIQDVRIIFMLHARK